MTKTQGNIIIVLLLAALFLLLLVNYNLFNGLAGLSYKIGKTQTLIQETAASQPQPSEATPKAGSEAPADPR